MPLIASAAVPSPAGAGAKEEEGQVDEVPLFHPGAPHPAFKQCLGSRHWAQGIA